MLLLCVERNVNSELYVKQWALAVDLFRFFFKYMAHEHVYKYTVYVLYMFMLRYMFYIEYIESPSVDVCEFGEAVSVCVISRLDGRSLW